MPLKDPIAFAAYRAAYRAAHRKELAAKQRIYAAAHKEHYAAYGKAYLKTPKGKESARRSQAKFRLTPASKLITAKYKASAKAKYHYAKNCAKARGIYWFFDLRTWLESWEQSGVWALRGKRSGHFQMCRYGDNGSYSPYNVYFATTEKNVSDSHANGCH